MLPEGVVGVVHAVNDGVAEVTAGLAQTTLFGADEFEERIGGLTLRLSAGAFMQTNSEMSQVLYRHAIEQARLRPGDVAWDLYCGAGRDRPAGCAVRRAGDRRRDLVRVRRPRPRERGP